MNAPGIQRGLFEELRTSLPTLLPGYLLKQRWFGGKSREIYSTELTDAIPLRGWRFDALVLIVRVEYTSGPGETYVLPVLCNRESSHETTPQTEDDSSILNVCGRDGDANLILSNALANEGFLTALLEALKQDTVLQGVRGRIRATTTTAYKVLRRPFTDNLRPKAMKIEQSNSSIIYGDRLILKCFRRLDEGVNPELEMCLFLTEKTHFSHIPRVAGWLEYRDCYGKTMTLGICQEFVPNQGDAWQLTHKAVSEFLPQAVGRNPEFLLPDSGNLVPLLSGEQNTPCGASKCIIGYLDRIRLLAKRTAELHLALASKQTVPAFAAEPFTPSFQQALETELRDMTARTFDLLERKMCELPPELRCKAEEVRRRETDVLQRFHSTLSEPVTAMRTRIHGDYHLGQVLYTGPDFVIIDFEGEPARPIFERRVKRSPLQDVASMLRSFHYAALAPLLAPSEGMELSGLDTSTLVPYAESWHVCVAQQFLKGYLGYSAGCSYLPANHEEIYGLLQFYLLEKSIHELDYELNHRPQWVGIPLAGIARNISLV